MMELTQDIRKKTKFLMSLLPSSPHPSFLNSGSSLVSCMPYSWNRNRHFSWEQKFQHILLGESDRKQFSCTRRHALPMERSGIEIQMCWNLSSKGKSCSVRRAAAAASWAPQPSAASSAPTTALLSSLGSFSGPLSRAAQICKASDLSPDSY